MPDGALMSDETVVEVINVSDYQVGDYRINSRAK